MFTVVTLKSFTELFAAYMSKEDRVTNSFFSFLLFSSLLFFSFPSLIFIVYSYKRRVWRFDMCCYVFLWFFLLSSTFLCKSLSFQSLLTVVIYCFSRLFSVFTHILPYFRAHIVKESVIVLLDIFVSTCFIFWLCMVSLLPKYRSRCSQVITYVYLHYSYLHSLC